MDLTETLKNNRDKIVDRWVGYALSTYKSSEFFLKKGNAFANPVGSNIRQAFGKLYLLLAENAEPEKFQEPLDRFVRIRSVQEFSASQAVAPIHAVKHIVREFLAESNETIELINDLYDFEFAVDIAVLAAFDLYMQCRERLYQIRIKEIKSGNSLLTDSRCPSASS